MRYQFFKSYNYLSSFLAFVIWGTWAYYINIGSEHHIISALSQGVSSSIITLMMIKIIEYFYTLFPKKRIYFLLPSIMTVSITSSFVIGIHLIVKTENIVFTVFPTVVVSFLFALYTTKRISGLSSKKENRHV